MSILRELQRRNVLRVAAGYIAVSWLVVQVMALHSAGRQDESDVALTHLLTSYGDTHPFEIAKAFAWRDDPDNSFEWLDRALEKYRLQVLFSNQSPEFRNLYDDPRWDEFLRRIERHPDQLAEIRFDPQLPD
jgi:hypothetical protein